MLRDILQNNWNTLFKNNNVMKEKSWRSIPDQRRLEGRDSSMQRGVLDGQEKGTLKMDGGHSHIKHTVCFR